MSRGQPMSSRVAGGLGRNLLFAVAVVFFGVPVLWLVLAPSKSNNALTFDAPLSVGSLHQVGLAASNLFGYDNGIFWTWVINSLWYTATTVVLALVIAVPAGYGLAVFRFKGRSTVLFVTLMAMIVPAAALILPLYLEMSAVSLTNTPWSVILPLVFFPFGVYMIYLFAANSMPSSILEAARIDGASEIRIMLRIFVPIARPAIVMIGFFATVGTWNAFFLPFIMLTGQRLATLQTGLQILVTSTGAINGGNLSNIPIRAPEVALAALLAILPILLVFLFAQRYLAAGQSAGAEKG